MRKPGNNIVLMLGIPHLSRVADGVVEMNVRLYNTVDMVGPGPHNHLADGTPGYRPASELEEMLGNLRENIRVCYHGVGIDVVLNEEDSK